MKIWVGHGSEHSMNLVMIGRFKEASTADLAKQCIDRIAAQVLAERDEYETEAPPRARRFTDSMAKLLQDINLFVFRFEELEQFCYDVTVHVIGDEVVLRTDEIDVSAFLKLLLEKGARVEVYSEHTYPSADEELVAPPRAS